MNIVFTMLVFDILNSEMIIVRVWDWSTFVRNFQNLGEFAGKGVILQTAAVGGENFYEFGFSRQAKFKVDLQHLQQSEFEEMNTANFDAVVCPDGKGLECILAFS